MQRWRGTVGAKEDDMGEEEARRRPGSVRGGGGGGQARREEEDGLGHGQHRGGGVWSERRRTTWGRGGRPRA